MQGVDDGFAGAVGEAPGDGGTLLEESRGTGGGVLGRGSGRMVNGGSHS